MPSTVAAVVATWAVAVAFTAGAVVSTAEGAGFTGVAVSTGVEASTPEAVSMAVLRRPLRDMVHREPLLHRLRVQAALHPGRGMAASRGLGTLSPAAARDLEIPHLAHQEQAAGIRLGLQPVGVVQQVPARNQRTAARMS